jgi:glycosyltransferase involved in cell wall biosynthesis
MFCSYFPPKYSGAAKQALNLAKQLRGHGVHVEFATIRDSQLPSFEIYDTFPVHRLEGGPQKHFLLWANLLRFAWKNRRRFDILHCHGINEISNIIGPIAKLVGWRSLIKASMSNELSFLRRLPFGLLHRVLIQTVTAYIAISTDLMEEFQENGLSAKKILYIPNGVDASRFHPADIPERHALRDKFHLPKDRLIFLSVGVFDHRKNIGWLIKEWAKTNGFDTGAFLLTIGPQSIYDPDGRFFNELREIAAADRNNMGLINYVDNVEEYFRMADIFVLCSTNEGLPNVLLEATASGLPCLATRSKGTTDVIVEGETGYLFNLNDSEDFREKVSFFSRPRIDEMRQKARLVALERFDLDRVSERYHRLYEDLLKGGRLKPQSSGVVPRLKKV